MVALARKVLRLALDRDLPRDLPLADQGFDSARAGRVAEVVAAAPDAPAPVEGPDRLLWWTHAAAVVVGIALASGVWALLR